MGYELCAKNSSTRLIAQGSFYLLGLGDVYFVL